MKFVNDYFKISLFAFLSLTISINKSWAQCNNVTQWPTDVVNISCGSNIIVNSIYPGEYSITSGYQHNSTLIFSSSISTDYITIRSLSGNVIIAHGVSPITMTYLSSYGDLKVNINTNATCASETITRISSVVAICGCLNTYKYPVLDIHVNEGNNLLTLSQFAGDYNVTQGQLNGALCIYSSSVSTDFIALRKASDQTLLATGLTPLTLVYSSSMGNIEMHINSDATCSSSGSSGSFRTTSMKMEFGIYRGGIANGFSTTCLDQGPNPTLTMYRGGIDDGFSSQSYDQGPNPELTLYRGGIDDGFVSACIDQGPNPTLTMYRGGIDDGFVSTCIDQGPNPTLAIYRGGIDDGFTSKTFDQGPNPTLSIYNGGIDDGFTLSSYIQCNETVIKWAGSENISWHNAQNWECGILPTITSDVIIPSGAVLFPTVSANDEIRSLLMQPGTSINISAPARLKLNGY
jgi:hypothetical protein